MIVITGASDGLGKQLAKLYKEAGKKVLNISRENSEYADHNVACDLSKKAGAAEAAQAVLEIEEPIEAVVNCAGVFTGQSLGSIDDEEIERAMSTNVKSQILLVSNLIERIKKDGSDIVNVSSTVGTKGYPSQSVYGASKWAVRGFSKSLQAEFKDLPNRVISFCPGGMKTKLFEKSTGIDNTENGETWMDPSDMAMFMKQILDLPKNMQVSEVIIDRKK